MNTSRWIVIGVAVAALVGLFVLLRPSSDAPAPAPAPGGSTSAPAPIPIDLAIVLKGTKVFGIASVVPIAQGTTVTVTVETDGPGEVHLHGYELLAEATPGAPAKIEFVADAPGRFELAFHSEKNGEVPLTEFKVS